MSAPSPPSPPPSPASLDPCASSPAPPPSAGWAFPACDKQAEAPIASALLKPQRSTLFISNPPKAKTRGHSTLEVPAAGEGRSESLRGASESRLACKVRQTGRAYL